MCVYVAPCPEAWKAVTIHHLLTHTSGIPTYTGIPAWREVNMMPKTTDQIIAFFRDLPLQWAPGEKFAYNNSGYFLLGVIIEKITGKKYEQALQEMILTPLGLPDTGYDWSKTILPRRAAGYSGVGSALANTAALDMQQPYAAGSMYSTVEDLLKWDQALYTEHAAAGRGKATHVDAVQGELRVRVDGRRAHGDGVRRPSPGLARRRDQRFLRDDRPPARTADDRHRAEQQRLGKRKHSGARHHGDLLRAQVRSAGGPGRRQDRSARSSISASASTNCARGPS